MNIDDGMRPFDRSLPMALLRAREAAMRRFRPLLAEHNLTEQQWRVLRALTTDDDAIEPTLLADRTVLLAPSLSRILAKLEIRGLITRKVALHDQRRALIELSDDGRRMVADIGPASERIYRDIESVFGADRLSRLLCELDDLAALAVEPEGAPSSKVAR